MSSRNLVACVLAGVLLLVPTDAALALGGDTAKEAWNIMPPGQSGDVPADANSSDQVDMYDGLTPLFDSVQHADIERLYKPETFGPGPVPIVKTVRPRRGLKIDRDRFLVPHIYGKTRYLTVFGAGWVAADDRRFLIELAREPARLAAIDPPGIDAIEIITDLAGFVPSAATERRIASQRDLLLARGAAGRQVISDVEAFTDGINAFYRANDIYEKPWTFNDVAASAALFGLAFGRGGGEEVLNANFLAGLQQRLGAAEGTKVFHDLRELNDADAPTTIQTKFPYMQQPQGATPGSPLIDHNSISAGAVKATKTNAATQSQRKSMAILAGASRSLTGRPLAVMGPQAGYFYPSFIMELDMHGGGINARGMTFPAVALYPFIGRGPNFAWSSTDGQSDTMDQFLEELCNPRGGAATRSTHYYRFKGKCRPMNHFNAGTLLLGQQRKPVRFWETVHGPVSGTVTVKGKPYAVAASRSSRGREVLAGLPLSQIVGGKVNSAKSFNKAVSQVDFSANWFYLDAKQTGFFHAGRYPVRAAGTDPSLPTIGNGKYEWRSYLSQRQHPQAVDPAGGLIVNWNNKPAPGFGCADNNWSCGSVFRDQLYKGFADRNDLLGMTRIMNRAATQDLRSEISWPVIRRVLGDNAPSELARRSAELLDRWHSEGSSRLDRDLDGKIDAPGAAVMDRAWTGLSNAVLEPVLGPMVDELAALVPRDKAASSRGSSYIEGWYGYIDKDLKRLIGEQTKAPFSRGYCGNGDLSNCRASLWAALARAGSELAAEQGGDPDQWSSDATKERIDFRTGLLRRTMRWTNRSSFQQLIEFAK